MKLQFFLDRLKRDMGLVPQRFVESEGADMAKLDDVMRVVQRWETALVTEDTLTIEAQRFEDLLNKEGYLTPAEQTEAFEILMVVHMPLIRGQNDVMGYRLKDADYYRLNNKLLGRKPEAGLDAFDEKYSGMIKERNEAAEKKKKAALSQIKKREEKEQKRHDSSVKSYYDSKEV